MADGDTGAAGGTPQGGTGDNTATGAAGATGGAPGATDNNAGAGGNAGAGAGDGKATPEGSLVGKTGEDPAKAGDGKDGADPAKKNEPAKVDAFDPKTIQLPDGLKADDAQLAGLAEVLNDDKASPKDRGEKLLNMYTAAVSKVIQDSQTEYQKTVDTWVAEVKADKEIGGANLEPTTRMISKAIDQVLPADVAKSFRQALDITGAGNHPAIVKGLAKMAKLVTEGGHVAGGPPDGGEKDLGKVFFPKSMEQMTQMKS